MKKDGFTLVELLAVIAILAVLIVIAVPAVQNITGSAKDTLSAQEEKNIKDAAKLLALDLDDTSSEIFNCKDGWVVEYCTTSDDDKHWTQVNLPIEKLTENKYLTLSNSKLKEMQAAIDNIEIDRSSEGDYTVEIIKNN